MDRLPPPYKTKADSNITELLVSAIQNYAPLITIALLLYGLAELFPIFSGDRSILSVQSLLALQSLVAIAVIDICFVYAMWWALGKPGQTIKAFVQEAFTDRYRHTDRRFFLMMLFGLSSVGFAFSVFMFFTGF